ncbi:RNA polymerase sigma factor [Haliangium sp.]|uniref:RNA polymerase sigma factor n=1 Tax=Haliangium sp. TaxID=2663208 RepID=UPI003D0A1B9D
MLQDEADESLMMLYQQGDVRAFEVLLERHRRPIFNFILRSVRARDRAEDLMQETFLRVVKGAAGYKKQAKFTTWLYTIARNLCVDHSRRQKHRRHASLDQPIGGGEERDRTLMDVVSGDEPGSDRKAVSRRLHLAISSAIDTLPDDQREVFLLREFQSLPFKDIGEIVGVPENTVKSRMRYALEKLRNELEQYQDLAKTLR